MSRNEEVFADPRCGVVQEQMGLAFCLNSAGVMSRAARAQSAPASRKTSVNMLNRTKVSGWSGLGKGPLYQTGGGQSSRGDPPLGTHVQTCLNTL